MTNLADRIHALTGAEGNATLREIDGAVATLIGWWPDNTQEIVNSGFSRLLINENRIPCGTALAPRFTASLHATLAEIKRRGWGTSHVGSILTPQCRFSIHIDQAGTSFDAHRKDDNLALAALEALVRAVEAAE